jgi:hypothetical protein
MHDNSSYHQVFLRILDSASACQSNVFAKRLSVVESGENRRVDLKIYPNPVQSFLWLSLPEQISGMVEVQIINTAGQLIKSVKQDVDKKEELSVNLELLDPAVYTVRVLWSFGSYTERITKT